MGNEFEAVSQVSTRVDLRARFPQAKRVIFMRSFWELLALLLAGGGYLYTAWYGTPGAPFADVIKETLGYIFALVAAIVVIRLIYQVIFAAMYAYTLELEHLTITQGVFFRSRASFPVAKINDVSIKRSPIELIFVLYSLNVLTASPTNEHGTIDGLSRKNAVDLQSYVLTLVETTLPDVKERAASIIMEEDLTAGETERLLHNENAQRDHT